LCEYLPKGFGTPLSWQKAGDVLCVAKAHMTKVPWIEVLYTFSSPILILLYVGLKHSKASSKSSKNVNGNINDLIPDILMPLDEINDIETCSNSKKSFGKCLNGKKKNIVCQMEICLYAMNFFSQKSDLTF
jgi:hypothetical protein